jgi:hypothetical protein
MRKAKAIKPDAPVENTRPTMQEIIAELVAALDNSCGETPYICPAILDPARAIYITQLQRKAFEAWALNVFVKDQLDGSYYDVEDCYLYSNDLVQKFWACWQASHTS